MLKTWVSGHGSPAGPLCHCRVGPRMTRVPKKFGMTHSIPPHTSPFLPEAPNVPPFLGTRKKRSNYRFLLDPPKNARPPKKRSTTSPSSIQRKAGLLRFLNLHSFADICARFADICARFALDFCSLLLNIQRLIILEDRPARFWEKRSKQEKVYVYHILVTTPGFAIRLG